MRKAPIDRAKLAKVLGLLSSNHDGEVLAAARMAQRIIQSAGTTWEEAVHPATPEPRIVVVQTGSTHQDPRSLAVSVLSSDYQPDAKEASFLQDFIRRRARPSVAQIRWIKIIAVKAGVL